MIFSVCGRVACLQKDCFLLVGDVREICVPVRDYNDEVTCVVQLHLAQKTSLTRTEIDDFREQAYFML
jgi:hypothetical protein